jgi:endonuclease YncB( thermonuclease family)
MPQEEEQAKLWVILILIAAIVASVVFFNGILPARDIGDDDIYIPDYGIGEYVEYVNDGDTFKTVEGDYIRLLGINTEETGMPHAGAAKNRLAALLGSGEIRLEADEEDKDRYGRLLRYVWAGDIFVNLELLREGHAHVYIIEPNVKYSGDFWAAEQEAIDNQVGLWDPSPYDVEITEIDPVQASGLDGLGVERVEFMNVGSVDVDMSDWTVKDESTHIYHFEDFSLSVGSSVVLRSGLGTDTDSSVYWQLDSSIWNNAGDICFLRDENGLLVDAWRYWPEGGVYYYIFYTD